MRRNGKGSIASAVPFLEGHSLGVQPCFQAINSSIHPSGSADCSTPLSVPFFVNEEVIKFQELPGLFVRVQNACGLLCL